MPSKEVDEYLNEVSYKPDPNYIPSEFALDFVNFIKLVNADRGGEENKTPIMHLHILDTLTQKGNTVNLCHRGSGKSTVLGEYGILYMAVYGELPGFGDVTYMLYVTDSIENGVKSMRDNLENRIKNSSFLQEYLPNYKITESYWEFTNKNGHVLAVNGYGAGTGIRGTKKKGVRPQIAILDDLLSDKDAASPTVIQDIENTIYISVKNNINIEAIKTFISEKYQIHEEEIVINLRHYDILTKLLQIFLNLKEKFLKNISNDILMINMNEAIALLNTITGETTSNEILNNIFKHFCIGK